MQILGMIFYPLLVHLLILMQVPAIAVLGLVATSLVYFILVMRLSNSQARLAWTGIYALLAAVGIINVLTHTVYALYLPPVIINLGLMALFGATLRSGSLPLVERLMRMEYQGDRLPAALQRLARQLTWLWVAYFAAVAVVSVILAAFAPLEVWSLFSNVLNYVFAITLFVSQYVYRFLRFRQYGVFMPWDTMRAIARISAHDRSHFLFNGRDARK